MKERLIELILKYGIVGTNFKEPITFKSGIKSPIYCNFRKTTSYNDLLDLVILLLKEKLLRLEADCVAGVATGAVPYSSICGRELNLPSCYVRPDAKPKEYGLKQLVEGSTVSGLDVALIEDLVSTSGSIVNNAQVLKVCGAEKINLISIFSYDMERSRKELAEAGFELDSLITIDDILPAMKEKLSPEEYESLIDWVRDPEGWFDRHKIEFDFGFLTTLRQSAAQTGSIISFGHDPVLESLPDKYTTRGIDGYADFMNDLFSEMNRQAVYPGMFKPNLGWWLCYDRPYRSVAHAGSDALTKLMQSINNKLPASLVPIPINLDTKMGDISKSSGKYASHVFEGWEAGAVTVHTYMGSDSVEPFSAYCNKEYKKGVYMLVRTTNKGASDLEMKKMSDGRFVYEHVADNVINWAKNKPGVGVVAAGNSPEDLMILGKMFAGKDIPLLIPGVGKSQGGDAGEVAKILKESGVEPSLIRINLSSGLSHPWYEPGKPNPSGKECIEMIIETLRSLNEQVASAGCTF